MSLWVFLGGYGTAMLLTVILSWWALRKIDRGDPGWGGPSKEEQAERVATAEESPAANPIPRGDQGAPTPPDQATVVPSQRDPVLDKK